MLQVSTKLYSTVLAKIDQLRGKDNRSEYIDKMLVFFEVSGANPNSLQTHPTVKLLNEVERIIKIMKAQEKTILEAIKGLKGNDLTSIAAQSTVEGITVEQLQEITLINDRLKDQLENELRKNRELIEKVNNLEHQTDQENGTPGAVNTQGIREAVKWLMDNGKPNSFSKELSFPKTVIEDFSNRIISYLNT